MFVINVYFASVFKVRVYESIHLYNLDLEVKRPVQN